MARQPYQYIELDGPLFDDDMIHRFRLAVREGIGELAEEGEGIMASVIANAGFVKTGGFVQSVDSFVKFREGDIGYAKIYPTDAWAPDNPGRPTRTWADRGTRKGVRLRKSLNIFSRSATGLRRIDQEFIADKIAEALN